MILSNNQLKLSSENVQMYWSQELISIKKKVVSQVILPT